MEQAFQHLEEIKNWPVIFHELFLYHNQSYRLLVASRLYWLPYPGWMGKEVRFSAILGRSLLEVAKWKR